MIVSSVITGSSALEEQAVLKPVGHQLKYKWQLCCRMLVITLAKKLQPPHIQLAHPSGEGVGTEVDTHAVARVQRTKVLWAHIGKLIGKDLPQLCRFVSHANHCPVVHLWRLDCSAE